MSITLEDIRQYVADASIADNELAMDFTFSNEDIASAMRSAARSYNSIPPLIGNVNPDCLPADTNLFFDGVAMHLCMVEYQRRTKADIDYSAGGVITNLVAKRIIHLQGLIKMFRERFEAAAQALKLSQNIRAGYCHFY